MKLIKISLLLMSVFAPVLSTATSQTSACPNLKKTSLIARELRDDFLEKLCVKPLLPKQAKGLIESSLPRIMNKKFLGVEPPPNWKTLANNLLDTCYRHSDLCKKDIQKEVNNCLKSTIPFLIVQLGPWFGNNCQELNQAVIEQWETKKVVLDQVINEYLNKTTTQLDNNKP